MVSIIPLLFNLSILTELLCFTLSSWKYHFNCFIDTDEYMTPVGEYTDLKQLLARKEREDIKVLNWTSKRSRPRHQYFNRTISAGCNNRKACIDPALPKNKTFLEVYNCNIEKPERKNTMPAEKAVSSLTKYTPRVFWLFSYSPVIYSQINRSIARIMCSCSSFTMRPLQRDHRWGNLRPKQRGNGI